MSKEIQTDAKREEMEDQVKKLLGTEKDLSGYTIDELKYYMDGNMLFLQKTANMSDEDKKLYADMVEKTRADLGWVDRFNMADVLFQAEKSKSTDGNSKIDNGDVVGEPKVKPSPKPIVNPQKRQVLSDNQMADVDPYPLADNEQYFKALEKRSLDVRTSPTSRPFSPYAK